MVSEAENQDTGRFQNPLSNGRPLNTFMRSIDPPISDNYSFLLNILLVGVKYEHTFLKGLIFYAQAPCCHVFSKKRICEKAQLGLGIS